MEVIYRILMIVLGTWVLQYFLDKVIVVKTWYNSWVAKTFLFSGYSTIMLVGQVFTKRKKNKYSAVISNHESIHGRQWIELFSLAFMINIQLLCFGDISFIYFLWGILISLLAFYICYLLEYSISFLFAFFFKKRSVIQASNNGYQCSMFEEEAYANEENLEYLKSRIPFVGWAKYAFLIYKKDVTTN